MFNGDAANYMSRASIDFGLNGLTECSYAISLNLSGSTGSTQRLLSKQFGARGCRDAILSQAPDWIVNLPAYETWTRVLFTFKRNAIDQTDGIVYFNGVSQTIVSFVAAGYASNFTVLEESNNF
jgi:hypothetical protein